MKIWLSCKLRDGCIGGHSNSRVCDIVAADESSGGKSVRAAALVVECGENVSMECHPTRWRKFSNGRRMLQIGLVKMAWTSTQRDFTRRSIFESTVHNDV